MRDKGGVLPYLINYNNCINPGLVPSDLPTLSAVEQMLIARAYMHVEVKRYRGHQYYYSGRIYRILCKLR